MRHGQKLWRRHDGSFELQGGGGATLKFIENRGVRFAVVRLERWRRLKL